MEETITFHISKGDKENLRKLAALERLSLSTFCRLYLTKKIQENIKLDENAATN